MDPDPLNLTPCVYCRLPRQDFPQEFREVEGRRGHLKLVEFGCTVCFHARIWCSAKCQKADYEFHRINECALLRYWYLTDNYLPRAYHRLGVIGRPNSLCYVKVTDEALGFVKITGPHPWSSVSEIFQDEIKRRLSKPATLQWWNDMYLDLESRHSDLRCPFPIFGGGESFWAAGYHYGSIYKLEVIAFPNEGPGMANLFLEGKSSDLWTVMIGNPLTVEQRSGLMSGEEVLCPEREKVISGVYTSKEKAVMEADSLVAKWADRPGRSVVNLDPESPDGFSRLRVIRTADGNYLRSVWIEGRKADIYARLEPSSLLLKAPFDPDNSGRIITSDSSQ